MNLDDDNRLDIEHVVNQMAHATFGHGNDEEFLRRYWTGLLTELVRRRQEAVLAKARGET